MSGGGKEVDQSHFLSGSEGLPFFHPHVRYFVTRPFPGTLALLAAA